MEAPEDAAARGARQPKVASRLLRWLVPVAVLALVGTVGFLAWRALTDQSGAATAAAERVSRALTEQRLLDGTFGSTAGPADQDDLAATLKGMGTLRPVITVQSVHLGEDQRRGTARLQAEWIIHQGKPPWVQDAYVQLVTA